MTEIPEWRKALKDSSHPLYSFAWSLFREEFIVEKIAKRFADRQEAILIFLYTILDTEQLYTEGSLGGGYAPINAVELIGEWKVVEAVPRLLSIIEEDNIEMLSDGAAYALERMPAEAIEPILKFGQNEDHAMDAVAFLSNVGKGDERCFEFICSVLERMTEEFDIISVAEYLASNNVVKAESYFRAKTESGRLQQYRDDFQMMIEEVKSGL